MHMLFQAVIARHRGYMRLGTPVSAGSPPAMGNFRAAMTHRGAALQRERATGGGAGGGGDDGRGVRGVKGGNGCCGEYWEVVNLRRKRRGQRWVGGGGGGGGGEERRRVLTCKRARRRGGGTHIHHIHAYTHTHTRTRTPQTRATPRRPGVTVHPRPRVRIHGGQVHACRWRRASDGEMSRG